MLDQKRLVELQEYVQIRLISFTLDIHEDLYELEKSTENIHAVELQDFINKKRKPTLNQVLFDFIDKKDKNDTEVYKRAGIDRRLFSKIRSNPNYRPRKKTTIALALALELSIEETNELLSSAGYSLSDSDTSDLVIQFFLEKKIYDLHLVNEALHYFSLKPLTGLL